MLAAQEAFPLTRSTALARWREFQPRLSRYAAQRNVVQPPHEAVSRLSPAMRFGLLTAEEIVRESLAGRSLASVEKWVQEVCWRSYWKGWLEMRPDVWCSWRRRLRELKQTLPEATLRRAEEVEAGRSGVAVMDRFAHELRDTGYLHNHARMWWASYWIHVERLPWELGADVFFRQLLDADPASNTLSWRWVAGLQTAGKTYLVRRSNLERYLAAEELQDQTGLERLDDGCVSPCLSEEQADLTRQPLPEVPTQVPALPGRIGVWVHAEDLCLESSPLACLQPQHLAAVTSENVYARFGLSTKRRHAIRMALADGMQRASAHWQCPSSLIEASGTVMGLAQWAQEQRLDTVVAMWPAVGPVADVLPTLRTALQAQGVTLQLYRRPWEARLYPQARSGFFPFWESTRKLLATSLNASSAP